MLGVSEVEVANEIAAMEKENIICGYNTIIDWSKTGDEKVICADRGKSHTTKESWDLIRLQNDCINIMKLHLCI